MKKKILLLLVFFVSLGGLAIALFSTNKIKAVNGYNDYYFDIQTSQPTQLYIILYVRDYEALTVNSCPMTITGFKTALNNYESVSVGYTATFTRYSAWDIENFNAYVYSFVYPSVSNALLLSVNLNSLNVLQLEGSSVTENYIFPYPPSYKAYYDEGYDDGYDEGHDDGVAERNAYYEEYYSEGHEGYETIFGLGELEGYIEGQNSLDTMSWFQTVTRGVNDILSLKLLPSITIGALIFIPFMMMILSAVLWIWRRK